MWPADSPTELSQPRVVDPEVMTHLVNDRPPNLSTTSESLLHKRARLLLCNQSPILTGLNPCGAFVLLVAVALAGCSPQVPISQPMNAHFAFVFDRAFGTRSRKDSSAKVGDNPGSRSSVGDGW